MSNNSDLNVDEILERCITDGTRKSFFLFAGAGSGKTHSLVTLLDKIRDKWETQLKKEGRHVAVITYTNAATKEILSRLDYCTLFHVSTIHSFVWETIKHYQTDIKKYYLLFKTEEIQTIESKLNNAKNKTTKTFKSNQQKHQSLIEKVDKIKRIQSFKYNPNGNNDEYNSLSHADVIKIGSQMILESKLLQQIISQQ